MTDPAEAERRPGWWRSAVVYQIYPQSFADSNGDGVGDLPGVLSRLDHLDELGVDVVWLSPFYPSPGHDNGYDVSDHCAVDPIYGTLDDFDALLEGLHQRGMKLIIDLVVNHTSDEHPWFRESRSSRHGPKRDWYWWRPGRSDDGGDDRPEPTNWGSVFSGPAWTRDPGTGEYYLHLFAPAQPDLNWENPEVRAAVHEVMRWWIDRGIDGFRMDVINLVSKRVDPHGRLPDGPRGGGTFGNGMPHTANGPRLHEFLAEMHREVLAGQNLLTVGEMPMASVEDALSTSDPTRRELDMVFTFEHMDLDTGPGGSKWHLGDLRLSDLKETLQRWQDGLHGRGWNSLYWGNHDQPRIVSRWGDDAEYRVESAKTLGTLLHLLQGTPYIFQGEELGMTNADFTELHQYRDIESLNHAASAVERGVRTEDVLVALAAKSRDNARTPMQWDDTPNGGFTTGTPWIEVNPNHRVINAEQARRDPASTFHHYRALIALRHREPVVVDGRTDLLLADHPQVYAYRRTLDQMTLTVVANLSGTDATIDPGAIAPPSIEDWVGSSLLAVGEARRDEQHQLVLGPWASRVVRQA